MDNRGLLQDNISFSKGMIPQVDPINLPEGAYLDALNMMRNEVGIIGTECGTSAESVSLPTGYEIVGVANVGDTIVICSTNNINSEIGVLYNREHVPYEVKYNNTILGFNKSERVLIEYKKDYRGNDIIYLAGKGIALRRIDLSTIIPLQDFDKVTRLFLEYSLPLTSLDSVISGGKVLTGTYQFAARLVTENNNMTGFGPLCDNISIVESDLNTDRRDIDGAPPQTPSSNAIKVTINNIDTSFKYVEPCVVTYVGNANILKINSLNKIEINGKSSITFTYYGTEDELDTILHEELSADIANFTSARQMVQKDNTLLLANLEEEADTVNWQAVANSIDIKWVTKQVKHTEIVSMDGSVDVGTIYDLEDYKNPNTCNKYMGYRRDEVYSFTFTPIYTSGRKGNAYHIPATFTAPATDNVGYANAVDVYPANFPTSKGVTLANTAIRYHKMPDNVASPYWTMVDEQEYINILGIKTIINAAAGWDATISGYIIGRENRVGKETILCQGITSDVGAIGPNGLRNIPAGFGFTLMTGVFQYDPINADKRRFLFLSPDICLDSNLTSTPYKLEKVMQTTHKNYYLGPKEVYPNNRISTFDKLFPGTCSKSSVQLKSEYVITSTRAQLAYPASAFSFDSVQIADHSLNAGILLASTSDLIKYRGVTTSLHVEGFDYSMGVVNPTGGAATIYNLKTNNIQLYGSIYNKECLPIVTRLKTVQRSSPVTNTVETFSITTLFGGDTFISRYSHTLKWAYGPSYAWGNVLYYMVESNNNYNYRHYLTKGINNSINSTVPYYPKDKDIRNLCNTLFPLADEPLYNKQYSAQNTLQPTFTETINQETTTKFPNRIVYSDTCVEGEQFDSFRSFKSSSYHDIPKQYGNITGLFTQGTDLFIHTERALWKAFYNVLVTQTTSAGEVVLGNGGAFSRPSVPIVSLQGGYAGCKDISASVGTPLGRFFYDFGKSKLYLLGEGLQEVSNPAVFQLLRDTIGAGDVSLGYDYGRKRVLLSSSTGTLSFKPELQSFDSRHDYKFSHFISRGLKDYIISGSAIHYFDKTKVGTFFGTVYNSFIKVASVVNPSFSKRYVSGEVVLTSQNPVTKVNDPWAFFKSLKMYSRERNTGENTFRINPSFGDLEEFGEILVSKANNKFRFGFAQDIVDDINIDIQDPYNLKSHPRFTDEDRMFLPDMVDNHVILEFTIDNNQQKEIKIQSLIINFDQNIT